MTSSGESIHIHKSAEIALGASTRNAVVQIENRTSSTLHRKRVELWHGSIHVEHLPCERIDPQSTTIVAVQSVGVLIGCEFALSYNVTDSNSSASSSLLDIYVCAPFIGAPVASITSLLSANIECRWLFHFDSSRRLWVFHFVLFSPPSPAPLSLSWGDTELSLPRAEHRSSAADLSPFTKGQIHLHVQDFVRSPPVSTSDARSFLYVQVLRCRSVSPEDRVPPHGTKLHDDAAALAFVGRYKSHSESLYWSTPQFVKQDESPLFNEVFLINVDDVLRDGCVVRLIESSLFGAKQRVIAERRILAAHVLPEAQRKTLTEQLTEQLSRLQRLSSEYVVLYASPTHILERLKMKRDIDDLQDALQLLDDSQRIVARQNGIAAAVRFVSTELSGPSDMQHSLHIGFDTQGKFATRNIPPEWQRLFQKAGVLRNELDDVQTFRALLATIGDLAPLSATDLPTIAAPADSETVGAVPAPRTDSSTVPSDMSPKHVFARRARIAANKALELNISGLCAESRPTDAETSAMLHRRRALLAAASNAACNAAERESDLNAAALVAAKAAMYGRAADQAAVLLGGSQEDDVDKIDNAELDVDSQEELASSFSEDAINAARLPNVFLLPPRIALTPDGALPRPAPLAPPPVSASVPPPLPPPATATPGETEESSTTESNATEESSQVTSPSASPSLEGQQFEPARISMLDQIRQGSVLRSHRAELPNLKRLPIRSESTLINALHRAVMRRRDALAASTEDLPGDDASPKTNDDLKQPCDKCGEQLSHAQLFHHKC